MVPIAGETENGFRKLCAKYAANGLHCSSTGTGPAQVAVTIKAAIAALQGEKVPQAIALPASYVEYPNIKEGTDYYPNLSDNFFVGNSFPDCKIGFTADEIMGKSEANQ
jgi:ribose transport system substrate-binding protein